MRHVIRAKDGAINYVVAALIFKYRTRSNQLSMRVVERKLKKTWDRWGTPGKDLGPLAVVKAYFATMVHCVPPDTRDHVRDVVQRCRGNGATDKSEITKALRSQSWKTVFQPGVMNPETRNVFAFGATFDGVHCEARFIQPPWGWYGLLSGTSTDAIAWLLRLQASLASGVLMFRMFPVPSMWCFTIVAVVSVLHMMWLRLHRQQQQRGITYGRWGTSRTLLSSINRCVASLFCPMHIVTTQKSNHRVDSYAHMHSLQGRLSHIVGVDPGRRDFLACWSSILGADEDLRAERWDRLGDCVNAAPSAWRDNATVKRAQEIWGGLGPLGGRQRTTPELTVEEVIAIADAAERDEDVFSAACLLTALADYDARRNLDVQAKPERPARPKRRKPNRACLYGVCGDHGVVWWNKDGRVWVRGPGGCKGRWTQPPPECQVTHVPTLRNIEETERKLKEAARCLRHGRNAEARGVMDSIDVTTLWWNATWHAELKEALNVPDSYSESFMGTSTVINMLLRGMMSGHEATAHACALALATALHRGSPEAAGSLRNNPALVSELQRGLPKVLSAKKCAAYFKRVCLRMMAHDAKGGKKSFLIKASGFPPEASLYERGAQGRRRTKGSRRYRARVAVLKQSKDPGDPHCQTVQHYRRVEPRPKRTATHRQQKKRHRSGRRQVSISCNLCPLTLHPTNELRMGCVW